MGVYFHKAVIWDEYGNIALGQTDGVSYSECPATLYKDLIKNTKELYQPERIQIRFEKFEKVE